MRIWKIKSVPQPLVFRYRALGALGFALARVCCLAPQAQTGISVYRGEYYLAVWATLLARPLVQNAAGRNGTYLGPVPVRYAYYAEHGRELSRGVCGLFQTYG